MPPQSRRSVVLNSAFTMLIGLGILVALLGIGIDVLPGSYPGLNLLQMLLIIAGLLCSLTAFVLRRGHVRRRILAAMRKHWAPGLLIAVITLIVLEFVLANIDIPVYFPDIPEDFADAEPWWLCDEFGCRFIPDAVNTACENRQISGRPCIVNPQGFHDTQSFVAGDDFDGRMRILVLGDSFTFGWNAEIGKSYVETIESNLPQSIVWNTGMLGAGTEQALALFQVYAPVLQPQLTILGFYRNDFVDNVLPMDLRLWLAFPTGRGVIPRRRQVDDTENAITPDHQRYYYLAHRVEPPGSEIERLIGRTRLGSLLLRMRDRVINMVQARPVTTWAQEVDITAKYLRDLRDAAAAQDTALLVLLIPDRTDIPPPPSNRYYEAVQLMDELKISYLNPIHILDAESDYMPDPNVVYTHWSTAGHQKIGDLLSACLAAFQISGDLTNCEGVVMP